MNNIFHDKTDNKHKIWLIHLYYFTRYLSLLQILK